MAALCDRFMEGGCESPFAIAAFRPLLPTGCRHSQIQTLKWEYVSAHHLLLPDSKTGARRIPLSPDAAAVLRVLPRDPGNAFVIQGKLPSAHLTDFQYPWQRLRNAAGLADVRINDLRHTFASIASMNGIDLLTLGKILGHLDYQTTQVTVHSDQGSQFTSREWQTFLRQHGLEPSMSRRGNCHDNAVVESFFQLLKRERIRRRTYPTRDNPRRDVFEYIELFYNPKRKHTNNGMPSPVDFEIRQQILNQAGF